MANAEDAGKIELNSMTKLQHDFHNSPPSSTENNVDSIISGDLNLREIWMVPIENNAKTEQDKTEERMRIINFIINTERSFLRNAKIVQELNAIQVKEAYRDKYAIRYTENLAHHLFHDIIFKCGDRIAGNYDSIWMDSNKQFNLADDANYDYFIGNRDYLINWSHHLPQDMITLPIQFDYAQEISRAFPLWLIHQNDKMRVLHTVKYENDILRLIQMAEIVRGIEGHIIGYQLIPPKLEYLQIFGQGGTEISNILEHIPEMLVDYLDCDPSYYRLFRETEQTYNYAYRKVISVKSTNAVKFGQSDTFALTSDKPAQICYFNARSVNALQTNSYSNYTTNLQDIEKGKSPISHESYKYGNNYKFKDRASNYSSSIGIYKNFNSIPKRKGYHAITWSFDRMLAGAHIHGQVLKLTEPSLILTLGESYPIYQEKEKREEKEEKKGVKKDKYDIFLRIECVELLRITHNGNVLYTNSKDDEEYIDKSG